MWKILSRLFKKQKPESQPEPPQNDALKQRLIIAKLEKEWDCPIWVTREGEFVPLAIMSERHMRNCIGMLTREINATLHSASIALGYACTKDFDSMGGYYAEHEADRLFDYADKLTMKKELLQFWYDKRFKKGKG